MNAEVYYKNDCPFCHLAIELLEKRNITHTNIDVSNSREALIERVEAATGKTPKTVPQIFLDGVHIGGYDNLVEYFRKADSPLTQDSIA